MKTYVTFYDYIHLTLTGIFICGCIYSLFIVWKKHLN